MRDDDQSIASHSFSSVYEALNQKVWTYLLQKVPFHTAEDLLQDIWLAVYKDEAKLAQVEHLAAWVFTIAKRRVMGYYGKKKRSPEVPDSALTFLPEKYCATDSPDRELNLKEIRLCMAALKEPAREIATMFYLAGMSSSEIAATLDMNENTVKSVVRRAKLDIFDCTEGKGKWKKK